MSLKSLQEDIDNITINMSNISIHAENLNNIIPSELQTKKWRKESSWYINGKHNECELYQVKLLNGITGFESIKTNLRLNINTYCLSYKQYPMRNEDGFEWTENFDRVIYKKEKVFYINLKMICDSGGSQTRTLREIYHFIMCQLEHLVTNNSQNVYFVNILDGDTSNKHLNKFLYLLKNNKYINILEFIYIGDMYNFHKYWNK